MTWEVDSTTVFTCPESGDQRCIARNDETGEAQEFFHERGFEDAASFCYWGNKTSEEIREDLAPMGPAWREEQAERRGGPAFPF